MKKHDENRHEHEETQGSKSRKLVLNKETLRNLDSKDLSRAVGGWRNTQTACDSLTCTNIDPGGQCYTTGC